MKEYISEKNKKQNMVLKEGGLSLSQEIHFHGNTKGCVSEKKKLIKKGGGGGA